MSSTILCKSSLIRVIAVSLLMTLIHNCWPSHLVYHDSRDTLSTVLEVIKSGQKGMFMRFGDGDINLATGKHDMFQHSNARLQHEMREAMGINGPGVLKGLCLQCKEFGGFEEGMLPGKFLSSYEGSSRIFNQASEFWGTAITDVYCVVALHYLATDYKREAIRFLRELKQQNCTILVGNELIPESLRTQLFGTQCAFIPTPSSQAYRDIDRIENEVLQEIAWSDEYQVIILAMGCTGRVLQKRLWHKVNNLFIFDFGSLMDAFCEWDTRAWMQLSGFNASAFLKELNYPTRTVYTWATDHSPVRIVCTTALIDYQFEERKKEYERSFNILKDYGHVPYIVESLCTGKTFLDEHSKHVCYTKTNNAFLKNKGVNEARSLQKGLATFGFDDDDMIIKLTGRYFFNSNAFIQLAQNSAGIDAIVKYDRHRQVITGCCAMRYKYFKEMLDSIDYTTMEQQMINFEREMANYIRRKQRTMKVQTVDKLNVTANIFGHGNCLSGQW